jgi:hypothetical protein
MFLNPLQKGVILRACDYFDLRGFFGSDQMFFNPFQKGVILSGALTGLSCATALVARSRMDPDGTYLKDAAWSFSTTEAIPELFSARTVQN